MLFADIVQWVTWQTYDFLWKPESKSLYVMILIGCCAKLPTVTAHCDFFPYLAPNKKPA